MRPEDNKTRIKQSEIERINRKKTLRNNQGVIVKGAWYFVSIFLIIIVLAIIDLDSFPIHPAIVMISIFFLLVSLIVGYLFKNRETKLESLISGENLLASWTLDADQKKAYVNYLFNHEKGKNYAILIVISFISIIIFGIFILIIDDGKLAMFLMLMGLLVLLSVFALGMPRFYKNQNLKNDGIILIGTKYAYINGYFHNWDYKLSGLSKVKIMKTPFYGIKLVYYYTDRTSRHSEEIFIPANENENLGELVKVLKQNNK